MYYITLQRPNIIFFIYNVIKTFTKAKFPFLLKNIYFVHEFQFEFFIKYYFKY